MEPRSIISRALLVLGYVVQLLQSCLLVLLQFYLHFFFEECSFLSTFFLKYDKPMGRNETTVGVGLGLRWFGSLEPDVRPGCSIRSCQEKLVPCRTFLVVSLSQSNILEFWENEDKRK